MNMIAASTYRAASNTVLLCLIFSLNTLAAQITDFKFEHLTTEDGLSHNRVEEILMDRQGFMWFATTDGLNKYDGSTFTVYKHDAGNPGSISGNTLWALCEDRSGAIWVGSTNGLNKLDRETEQFTHFKHDPGDFTSISHNEIHTICEDSSGELWVGTNIGLNRFDPETGKFTRLLHDPDDPGSIDSDDIMEIYEDYLGVLWVGTTGGLNRFDQGTGKFTRFLPNPDDPYSLMDDYVQAIGEDQSGALWVGGSMGADKLDRKTGRFTHYRNEPDNPRSISSNLIKSIHADRQGVFWVSTSVGLNICDHESGQFTRILPDPSIPHSINDDYVLGIYEDRLGVLWFATGNGVNKLDQGAQRFAHYKYGLSKHVHMPLSLYEDRTGILWVGTFGGLLRVDQQTGHYTLYDHNPDDPASLKHDWVYAVHEDQSGTLWVGTSNGLNILDRETGQFFDWPTDPEHPDHLRNVWIYWLDEDRRGTLWMGTSDGLIKLDQKLGRITHYRQEPDNSASLSDNSVHVVLEDHLGAIWVGTRSGLNRLDPETGQFTRYIHEPDEPGSLSNSRVFTMCESASGDLWIGTNSGLNRFDRETEAFIRFGEQDGLPSIKILGVLEDEHGKLWMSTENGLSAFNPTKGIFKNYDVKDGLQENSFRYGSYHKARDGRMFFGGVNGFNAFYPDSIKDNPFIPPVVITEFALFNEPVGVGTTNDAGDDTRYILPKHISFTRDIELSYRHSVFSFEFAALNYRHPEKNQYAYTLEGFDEDWYPIGADRRFVTYTNLNPGQYVFRVKGSNNDGVWNETGASIAITIAPPFWRTWWAYILYALAISGAMGTAWRATLNRARTLDEMKLRRRETEKLQGMDQLKSRFFANISHEFRTPLTLILGPIEQSIAKVRDKALKKSLGIAHRNAGRLLRLINQLLDLSKMETGNMRLEAREEDLVPLLRRYVQTFESLAEIKRITLRFHAVEDRIKVYIDRDKLEKIISNLLSNALKFTPEGGIVDLSLSVADSILDSPSTRFAEIEVSDTGVGIAVDQLDKVFDRFYQVDGTHTREQEGTGIGLALAKELVELHHGEITVTSAPGRGSRFVVQLPLGRAHLRDSELADPTMDAETPEPKITLAEAGNASPPAAASAAEIPKESRSTNPKVLIVEDNLDMRDYIRGDLEADYSILEAKDGNAGLRKARDQMPELIISDVMMPGMDGFELCEQLKTDERISHIPVILLTAKAEQADKLEGLETGADDYITKPFDVQELHTRVRNLIEQRQRLRERFRRDAILEPKNIAVTSMDERFLQRALDVLEAHMSESGFGAAEFARAVGMSRASLHNKLRALTGQSTSEFIRIQRLVRAAQLLKKQFGNVTEVAFEVGFSNPSYFAECFKKQFGRAPSRYVP